jgi:pyrimidine-nucleoside phosphorylase
MDALKAGLASVELGCGRKHIHDMIDYSAGIILNKKPGDSVKKGDMVYTVYGESKEKIQSAKELLTTSLEISNQKPEVKSRIIEVIY